MKKHSHSVTFFGLSTTYFKQTNTRKLERRDFLNEVKMWEFILFGLIAALSVWYLQARKKMRYFRDHNVAEDAGYFPFGSWCMWKVWGGKLSFTWICSETYKKFPNERFIGYYGFPLGTPSILVRDMDLIKQVLIKDFDYFTERRVMDLDEESNKYILKMLLNLTGEKWKRTRSMMSSAFTSGKLKTMMPRINKSGDEFVKYVSSKYADTGLVMECYDEMACLALDTAAKAGFGVEANVFGNPNDHFRQAASRLMGEGKSSGKSMLKMMVAFIFPKLGKLFKLRFMDAEAEEFFVKVIKAQISNTSQKSSKGTFVEVLHDTISQAVSGRRQEAKGPEDCDQFEKDAAIIDSTATTPFQFSDLTPDELETLVVSNALLLFFAGFATLKNAMTLCLYYLAVNEEVQDKAFAEVREVADEGSGDDLDLNLDYNVVQNGFPYLDMVIQESQRIFPQGPLERICGKPYKIPGTDFVIPKGMPVHIPASDIMTDEKYFPNPDRFNPENFSPEAKAARGPYPFLVFGQGPRNCVGMRFALIQMKVMLSKILYNFKIVPSEKTPKVLGYSLQKPGEIEGDAWLKFEKRA